MVERNHRVVAGTLEVEQQAIEAIRNRDERGLIAIQELYRTWVYGKAYQMLHSHEDAEDMTQEVFFHVVQKIGKFDPRQGVFSAWFQRLATNLMIDRFRHVKRYAVAFQTARLANWGSRVHAYEGSELCGVDEETPADSLMQSEVTAAVEKAIGRIRKTNHRRAFQLRHIEDKSIAEICVVMGCKENTAKVWVFRAIRTLREDAHLCREYGELSAGD